jgi:hypothetical protein
MNKSLVSMRDLLTRVNSRAKKLDLSTFSKASKTRDIKVFKEILNQGTIKLKEKNKIAQNQIYFLLDSTIIIIILQLTETPKKNEDKALDKLRYLQSFMNENISYIHWFRRMSFYW